MTACRSDTPGPAPMRGTPQRAARVEPETHRVDAVATSLRAPAPASIATAVGNQAMHSLLRGGWLRAKLEVGGVDDPEEREVDAVAERVMRMPEGACCAACPAGGSCEDEMVRRKPEAAAPGELWGHITRFRPCGRAGSGHVASRLACRTMSPGTAARHSRRQETPMQEARFMQALA